MLGRNLVGIVSDRKVYHDWKTLRQRRNIKDNFDYYVALSLACIAVFSAFSRLVGREQLNCCSIQASGMSKEV